MANDVVSSVDFRGSDPHVNLETQAGRPFDQKAVEDDVHRLWSMGQFEDIRVETRNQPGGTAVIFVLKRSTAPRLREVQVEPSSIGIKVRAPEAAIDAREAHQIASEAHRTRLSGCAGRLHDHSCYQPSCRSEADRGHREPAKA